MFFIILLMLSAFSIAGSAAYFSVYGLANTFHGTFWSVVIMGGSLEAGKLVTASYLYRFWTKTHFVLKSYLMIGTLALMILTSTGIFGYLSTGYQTDALPLKQIEQQVKLLDEEKSRLIVRKQQIDTQIANLPSDFSKGRLKLMKGFQSEQEQTTNRINQLDKDLLELKTKVIQTEAHIGPITYIAKAFDLDTDDATKYLVYLIIFVFDPMAVALTLALNIALRERQKENKVPVAIEQPIILPPEEPVEEVMEEPIGEDIPIEEPVVEEPTEVIEQPKSYKADWYEVPASNVSWSIPSFEAPTPVEEEVIVPQPEQPYVEPPQRRRRPYAGIDTNVSMEELLNQHQYYKTKEDQGDILTQDERWAYQAIKQALHTRGYNIYI